MPTKAAGHQIFVCSDLEALRGIWCRFQREAHLTPFQRFEWLSTWMRTAAGRNLTKPLVFLVFENDQLRMAAPLALEEGILVRRLVWLGQEINDYNAPIVDVDWLRAQQPVVLDEIWRSIICHEQNADFVHLIAHPSSIAGMPNPFRGPKPEVYSANAHHLALSRDWRTFYPALRSTKTRRRLREKAKRLKSMGAFRFRRVRDPDEATAMVRRVIAWKAAQLDRRGARNPFGDGVMETQLARLAASRHGSDVVRVFVIEIDGQPLAITVALVEGGAFNFFVSAFDDAGTNNASAGTIMIVRLIELAARAGLAKFDFSVGDEPYKADWCDGLDEITHDTRALTALGIPAAAIARSMIGLKRQIKSNVRLFASVQRANGMAAELKRRLGIAPTARPNSQPVGP